MEASEVLPTDRRPSRRRMWWYVILAPILGCALASWWLTAPLEDRPAPIPAKSPSAVEAEDAPVEPGQPPSWPKTRLEGARAKKILLATLVAVEKRLDDVEDYTAVLHKQERIGGILGPEQVLQMKVRQHPFAIYLKFLAPKAGKEVVYAEGHHDNKLIAHSTGVSKWLVPRLAVPPDHPLALAETRHAVTEAGLGNLTRRLVGYRIMDLKDPEAVTILDRTTGADGRRWLRSIHLHPRKTDDRPFARVEVLYDPDTRFPLQISNYDWPADGHEGDLPLAEHYAYEHLNLDVRLSAIDFDPANPAYAFHRY